MRVKNYTNEAYEVLDQRDYLNFVTKSSTKNQRRKFDIGDIFINAAVCLTCSDYIRSMHRHDFKSCKCGDLIVDGGSWYAKRINKGNRGYVDVIETFYDVPLKKKFPL